MIYRYGEDYPTQCPPEEAIPPENLVLYRACCEEIVVDGVLNSNNFVPVWEQRNRKFPPHAECGAKAISFNENKNKLRNTMIDHPKLGEKMISVKLNERCGVILKDGKYHFNLWDYSNPNLISAIGIDWEEVVFNG